MQQAARVHHDRRAAAGGHAEAAAAIRAQHRTEAEIVDGGAHVVADAAFERDLELARQRRAERMAEQISRQRFRVRRHVEALVGGDAGKRTGGDVADRIAARFARREAGFGQPAHRRLDIVQLDEVKLHVLPRRDVAESTRVPFGHFAERLELVRCQHALRNLHPQHLRVAALALAIRSPHQPELPPLVGRQFALLKTLQRGDEFVDLGFVRKRQPRAAERFRIIHD